MAGAGGVDRLAAAARRRGVGGRPVRRLRARLDLAATKPAALHDGDGYIDFGPAGGSYYYSRTAMTAAGTVTVGDRTLPWTGSAWFDHQWGDFISVGGGGWDWFAINLDDGTDITLSLVRAADGSYPWSTARSSTRRAGRGTSARATSRWSRPAPGRARPPARPSPRAGP